jgi:hypothetical protein
MPPEQAVSRQSQTEWTRVPFARRQQSTFTCLWRVVRACGRAESLEFAVLAQAFRENFHPRPIEREPKRTGFSAGLDSRGTHPIPREIGFSYVLDGRAGSSVSGLRFSGSGFGAWRTGRDGQRRVVEAVGARRPASNRRPTHPSRPLRGMYRGRIRARGRRARARVPPHPLVTPRLPRFRGRSGYRVIAARRQGISLRPR